MKSIKIFLNIVGSQVIILKFSIKKIFGLSQKFITFTNLYTTLNLSKTNNLNQLKKKKY